MKYIILSLIAFLVACYGKKPEKTGMEGKSMPEFSLLLPDSTTWFNTKYISAGKPSVLFLFGPQCPYSKTQMEDIIDDMKDLKDIHFYVFTPFPFRQMKQFYDKYQLEKYPNITAGIDTANFFGKYIGAPGVPYIALYDRKKQLNKAFAGKTSSQLIKAILEN